MDSKTSEPSSAQRLRLPPTFAALRHRNFRLWFAGQSVSLMGTWMQMVAQGWLVYKLTGSKLALGTISFIGNLPVLFLMVPAGVLADRVSRRALLLATQAVMTLQAFALAFLSATGRLSVWNLGLVSVVLGVANSFDAPARMALTVELVEDRRDVVNAIALNSSMFNMARIVGPAIGGLLLATVGASWCFTLNGISFLAVLIGLALMRFPPRQRAHQTEAFGAQIRAGLHYIVHNQLVVTMIGLITVSALFGLGYATLMPAYAADVLHVGEAGLGILNAVGGVGALVGSLLVASLGAYPRKGLLLSASNIIFPLFILAFAFSRSFALSSVLLIIIGFAFVIHTSLLNTLIQGMVPDALRGRVMSVYSLAFFGTTPFAALLAGATAQAWGITAALVLGGALTLLFALLVVFKVPALRRIKA